MQFSLQTKKTDSPCVLGLVADCYGVMVSIISMIMMAAAIPSSGWGERSESIDPGVTCEGRTTGRVGQIRNNTHIAMEGTLEPVLMA